MGPESLLTRWWNAVRPLPAAPVVDKATLQTKRRQRNLIRFTLLLAVLLAAGWYAYSYKMSAPQRALVEFEKGVASMRPGAYGDAIAHFDKSIETWPNMPEAYLNRGITLHSSSQRDAALQDLDRALALNPNLTEALDEKGRIYIENREPKEALKQFNESLRIRPTTEGFFERANLYESIGEHQNALDDYNRAIGELVDAPYAYRARAIAREKLGDSAGAKEDRQKALSLEDFR